MIHYLDYWRPDLVNSFTDFLIFNPPKMLENTFLQCAEGLHLPPPPFYEQHRLYRHSHLLSFFWTPRFWQYFFNYIAPMKYYKNKLIQQSYFFIFRRIKNNVMCFLYKHHFCKQHQTEIWSKIIIILSIKMIQKKINILKDRLVE